MERNAAAIVNRLRGEGFTSTAQMAAFIAASGLWAGGGGQQLPLGPLIVITNESVRPSWATDDAKTAMLSLYATVAEQSTMQTVSWETFHTHETYQRNLVGILKRKKRTEVLKRGSVSAWVITYTDREREPYRLSILVSIGGDAVTTPAPIHRNGELVIEIRESQSSADLVARLNHFGTSAGERNADVEEVARDLCRVLDTPRRWDAPHP